MDNNFNQGQQQMQDQLQQQQQMQQIQAEQQMQNQLQQQQQIQAEQQMQNQLQQRPIQPQFDPFANSSVGGNNTPNKIDSNMFPTISLILSVVGMFLVFIGTILTCTCSAAKAKTGVIGTSPVFVVTIFGIIFAIAGAVVAILKLKDYKTDKNVNKIAIVGFVLGLFAIIYGILPTITICGYNCQVNNAIESGYEDVLDYYFNPFN